MNLYEAKEFFAKMYPDREITWTFDDKCHRRHEINYTDGVPHQVHHVENYQVKMTVEGLPSMYVPIAPHRECYGWKDMKNMLSKKIAHRDVHIPDHEIEELKKVPPELFDRACQERADLAGLPVDIIKQKVLR